MIVEALWLSQQGTRTSDNRDHAGVGTRGGEFLGVIVDGSTKGPANGDYARAIARMCVDWFVENDAAVSATLLSNALNEIHRHLHRQFPRGSASFLLIHAGTRDRITILHSGDCVFGEIDKSDRIVWQSSPHTLVNALAELSLEDIASSPARHLLTRSFRAREFEPPDVIERSGTPGYLLLATDGFWAELTEEDQLMFLQRQQTSPVIDRDDRSVLQLRLSVSDHFDFVMNDQSSGNIYKKIDEREQRELNSQ